VLATLLVIREIEMNPAPGNGDRDDKVSRAQWGISSIKL
jgi:hypothetical protein